jgi:hypothetical protein
VLYIHSKNKELVKEGKGWPVRMLFVGEDESKDQFSMSAFFHFLLHSVSVGNPNGNLLASLAKAWGISSTTLWSRNSQVAMYLLAADIQLADAFKKSLKFKLTKKYVKSNNSIFQYIESKNKVGDSK